MTCASRVSERQNHTLSLLMWATEALTVMLFLVQTVQACYMTYRYSSRSRAPGQPGQILHHAEKRLQLPRATPTSPCRSLADTDKGSNFLVITTLYADNCIMLLALQYCISSSPT